MIISDLNHLEVISEETNLISGGWLYTVAKDTPPQPSFSAASVLGVADAVGYQTLTDIQFKTATVSGLFSSSAVKASSVSVG